MSRLVVVVALVASLLVSGCGTRQSQLPAGQEPDGLATAITTRGRGEAPPAPEEPPPEPSVLGKCVETTLIACGICLAVPVVLVYLALKAKMAAAPTGS